LQKESAIRSGLEERFPEAWFVYGAEVIGGYENVNMPIAGEQHPDEPDHIIPDADSERADDRGARGVSGAAAAGLDDQAFPAA
jgi:hypothetical protein